MPESWFNWIASQYFGHRLFRQDGLASSYLPRLGSMGRSESEPDFVRYRLLHPWRFVFCMRIEEIEPDYHVMSNMLTREIFLLFSPALVRTIRDVGKPYSFLLLLDDLNIGFQTYGPIRYFRSLGPLSP